jgi:ligand-binding sensor domain-containing protein
VSLRGRILALVGAVVALGGVFTYWQTARVVREAGGEVAAERSFAFTSSSLDRTAPPNVEYFASPVAYRQGIVYRGRLYLCGPAGLFADGEEWRVGRNLPPAPLVAMAVGVSSESHEPELWIATAGEGLLAFNGSKFRHIRPANPKHRKLTSVIALSSGRVLLGTEAAGVLVYDGRTLTPLHDDLRQGHITALAGDDSAVWIGTLKNGLREFRGGQIRTVDGLPDPQVLSLTVHGSDVYAGTAVGTALVRDARVQRVFGEEHFAQSLLADDQKLTIGTLDGIVTIPLRSGRGRRLDLPGSTTSLVDANGKMLAVGAAGVVDARSGETLTRASGALLTDRNISALAEDTHGRLWIGYFDRGLDVLDGTKVRHAEDDRLFCVNRVVHGPDYTAIATANGLVLMDRDARTRQVLGREEGLIANHVTDVALRGDGVVVATPAGLTFLEKGTQRSLYAFHGLVNNHVYALGSAEGALLAGTLGGISVLRGDLVQANYTTANSRLPHNWITAVARVGSEWWVGTYGEGVLRLDAQGKVAAFPDMPRAIVNPNAMLVAGSNVYAGTLEHGLLMYSEGRWQNVSSGLPSINVTALADCGTAVCVGTNNGLVRLR